MVKTQNGDFTQVEIDILSKNKNAKTVSSKQITYQYLFKELLLLNIVLENFLEIFL